MKKLIHNKLPNLNKILLIKKLTANLINISQLYNKKFNINFTKSEYLITNKKNKILIKNSRSKNNYYI